MDDGWALGDRYRLDARLGDGGMSVVWCAYDLVLGRSVAVKILARDLAASPVFRDTIRTEARAAASLSHPNVTAVYDYGESVDEAGEVTPYVVMELLSGQSLADRLAEGPLDPPAALRVCAEVASALAAAHAHGLVHRDIKPGNIMLTPAGAKVFDFGLAAPVGQRDDSDPDGPVLGTAAYLAPERLAGSAVTAASDVYALALLLFRAVTTRLPWPVHTVTEMIAAHVYAEPGPLPEVDGVPPEVRDLAQRCLSKTPSDRPTAHEAALILTGAAAIRAPARGRRSVRVLGVASVALFAVAVHVAMAAVTDRTRVGAAGPPSADPTTITTASAPTNQSTPTITSSPSVAPPPSATQNAGAAYQSGLTAPSPSTAGPSPGPTPTTFVGTERTFTSPGGSVIAACEAAGAHLVSWTPEPGYETRNIQPGPADVAKLVFRSSTTRVRVKIVCRDGVPTAKFDLAEIT